MTNEIISSSKNRLRRLKILTNFFDNSILDIISIKTEIIHNLFVENKVEGLDDNKLDLFHLQYTDSLIELLSKLKKSIETSSLIIINEININNDVISRQPLTEDLSGKFELERKYHSANVSEYLKSIYDNLTGGTNNSSYSKIELFPLEYGESFFREEKLVEIQKSSDIKMYEFNSVKIQTKLLGRLNKTLYKVRFVCGFIYNTNYYELFRYFQTDEEFIWDITNKEFFLVDSLNINKEKNTLKNVSLREELINKNKSLELKLSNLKREIPPNVIGIINEYRDMIENTNKIVDSLSFDEETNILKSMLNLKIIE